MSGTALDSILTKEDYFEMKLSGKTDEAISSECYVCRTTLHRWKSRKHIRTRDINRRRFGIIEELRKSGKTMMEISDCLCLSEKHCRLIYDQFKDRG